MPQWIIYVLIIAVVLPSVIARQLATRPLTMRRLLVLPVAFVVAAFAADHELLHRLASPLAVAALVVGLLIAAGTGLARAATMTVWRNGATVMTKGNRITLALWVATIALRIGEIFAARALGVTEGAGDALLFAAATFGVQGLALAVRGGMVDTGQLLATERVG